MTCSPESYERLICYGVGVFTGLFCGFALRFGFWVRKKAIHQAEALQQHDFRRGCGCAVCRHEQFCRDAGNC